MSCSSLGRSEWKVLFVWVSCMKGEPLDEGLSPLGADIRKLICAVLRITKLTRPVNFLLLLLLLLSKVD